MDGFSAGEDNSFMAKLVATHPPMMKRIGALEDGKIAKQSMGGLFVASPFATDNSKHLGNNRDVVQITAILGFAGILWCGWGE